jgi:exodeoxyribonuclease VII large subunit
MAGGVHPDAVLRRRPDDSAQTLNLVRMSPKPPATPQLGFLFEAAAAMPETDTETPKPVRRGRTRRTWLVHQLVAEAREWVEAEFGDVWVEGEISNLRPAPSGHMYFTLKDAEAQLPVVLFRRQALLLRFRPEDGLHVRVRGKVSVYEQRGQLQLVAETMEPVGAGSLQLAFEQLRDRLKAEGLFEQDRKRPLPAFPRCVAVVTSPTGAVIRDFLNIVGRRHSGLSVVIVPAAVQGDAAAAEIVAAIARVNEAGANEAGISEAGIADVIVLARGGGSLEDLAAFNSESVARAIAGSGLPVVSAIGHETDFTIADFVADLRAPTPSAAAELITEAQHRVEELLATLDNRLVRAARYQMLHARQRLARVPVAYAQQRVVTHLHRLEQRLDELNLRMDAAVQQQLRKADRRVAQLAATVLLHDPRQQLSAARVALNAAQSRLGHALDSALAAGRYRSDSLHTRLLRAAQVSVTARRAAWSNLRGELQALSPLAVLQRGYALVRDERGAVVRSVAQLSVGQLVSTRVADGDFASEVRNLQSNQEVKQADKKAARKTKDKSTQS